MKIWEGKATTGKAKYTIAYRSGVWELRAQYYFSSIEDVTIRISMREVLSFIKADRVNSG